MYLLDTNILSELRKRSRCHPHVATWIQRVQPAELYVSVIALGEIRKGVELISNRDSVAATKLDTWLSGLYMSYTDRILDVTFASCRPQ